MKTSLSGPSFALLPATKHNTTKRKMQLTQETPENKQTGHSEKNDLNKNAFISKINKTKLVLVDVPELVL